jgi:hypothetical protein
LEKKVEFLDLGPGPTGHLGKFFFETWVFAKIVVKQINLFYLASPEIIGVKFVQNEQSVFKFYHLIHKSFCLALFLDLLLKRK